MHRRALLASLGTVPLATIPQATEAAPGNRASQFAIASAMSFFHGVMADDHLPLDQRLEAARGLIGGAIHLQDDPTRDQGFTY